MVCRMVMDIMDGFMIGIMIWKKICGMEVLLIMVDFFSDFGMFLIILVKMNMVRLVLKFRYMKYRFYGVLSLSILVSLERVNMIIWNGMIMLNRNNVYSSFVV